MEKYMHRAPSLFQGISFQLAKIGILLAFALGFMVSSVQIYLDYRSHQVELDQLAQRVIQVTMPPAARAVHTLDDDLSAEVVSGVLAYDFIYHVSIVDELGNVLGEGGSPRPDSSTRWLTRRIAEESRHYKANLDIPGYGDAAYGTLSFFVDKDQALSSFYQRALRSLTTGLLRDMLLVLLLFFAFYLTLTKPLVRLAREIRDINPDQPGVQRLTLLPGRRDELAELVTGGNQLLDAVELSLARRRAVESALRKSEEHLRQIIDSLPVMIGARNATGHYLFANRALAEALGYTPESMRDMHACDLLKNSVADLELLLHNDQRVIRQGADIEIAEDAFVTATGKHLFLQTHIVPLQFYDEIVALVVSVDVTERKNAQAEMEHMAHHDALTNLPNRVQLVERLEMEIRRANRHGYCGAVLFIDLDQFKNINDSLGHPIGDLLLKEVAQRLVSAVRDEDLVARLSGDEFVLVLTVLDEDMSVAALRAGEISEKIRGVISRPYRIDDLELRITCSVGVVMYPEKNSTVHELLRFADTAMYQVKEKGRDSIEFFNEEMADKVSRQLVMEGDLHRALEESQFELQYQPKIDMISGNIVGAEALLRWHHPTKGTISPVEFIPVLETSGLILDVGQWVLEQACETLVHWQEAGFWKKGMRLSINISPRQFRRTAFADDVLATLAHYEIPEDSLEIEVTEGIVIQQIEEAVVTMTRLAEHGVSFSLDDFGTGYSSISYLKQLPVSVLKIDQSFVRDIIDDRNDRVLVETIITMARLLDLEVIAEGVEEQAQFNLLQKYGCHYFQGYYCSPAVSLGCFDEMLKDQQALLSTADGKP
jgi:diguanylate cyclase (GGDEF)-like protein/PAS domain S-box-containing protein